MPVYLDSWPYPRHRHVRPPDPLVREAWLREIGALPPERREWTITNHDRTSEDST